MSLFFSLEKKREWQRKFCRRYVCLTYFFRISAKVFFFWMLILSPFFLSFFSWYLQSNVKLLLLFFFFQIYSCKIRLLSSLLNVRRWVPHWELIKKLCLVSCLCESLLERKSGILWMWEIMTYNHCLHWQFHVSWWEILLQTDWFLAPTPPWMDYHSFFNKQGCVLRKTETCKI